MRRLQDVFGTTDRSIKYTTSEGLSQEFPGALVLSRYYGWALAVLVVVLIFVGVGLQGTHS